MISSIIFSLLLAVSPASPFSLTGMDKKEAAFNPRIVNGQTAKSKDFRYQVALISKSGLQCTGSLIDHEWVLTAAECTDEFDSIKLLLGTLNLNEHAVKYEIGKNNVFRPFGDNFAFKSDIALIKIPYVEYTKAIHPVALPHKFHRYFNTTAIASGWGYTSNKGNVSSSLQYATLNIISNAECRKYFAPNLVTPSTICTGHGIGGICFGDSGAPLVSTHKHTEKTLIGIGSFGILGGCGKDYPYGFTRVDQYLKWIRDTTNLKF